MSNQGQISWKTLFNPQFNPGGVDAINLATASRLFDNFESYADSTALQVVWTTTAVTITLETPSPLRGAKSLKGVVTNAANQIKATINPAIFQYPFPKKLRYVTFKTTVDSGTASFTFKIWGSADEANNYKEWTVSPKDKYTDTIIDLDADNTESFPAPSATGASYEPTTINRISFEDLTNGRTYYFDDIIFYYEYSLIDLVGFGTEPPISIGTDGSLHGRLNSIHSDVKGLEGQTQQYAKQGIAVGEMGQALQWALELNSDFAPPTTTEITPGTYDIDRVRLGVTTNMVNDSAASESTGTIYASYTPAETDWNIGDLIKVTFSGGNIKTDEEPSVLLTGTTGAGGTIVTVANAFAFEVGWLVKIVDDDTAAEWHTIASIDSPTTFTIDATTGAFTVAQNATVGRSIQTDLTTAVFFTMIQSSAQNFKILGTGTFTTSSATVPADTGRTEANDYWNASWLMSISGSVSNQPRLIVDFANAGGIFTIDAEQPFTAATGLVEYIIIGSNSQLAPAVNTTSNQTPAHIIGNKWELPVPVMTGTPSTSGSASNTAHLKALVARGMSVIQGICDSGLSSTTTIISDDLIGYGDDYFNNHFYMQVIRNSNSAGNAPEGEIRLITDYTSTTGTFVVDAFSAVVEANDVIILIHESIIFAWLKLNQLQTTLFMSDYDNFDTAVAATVNTVRWIGEEYVVGAGSSSTANINTTTSGKAYVLVDPAAAATGYWLRHKPIIQSRYFSAIIDATYTWGTVGISNLSGGFLITKGIAYDSDNYLYLRRSKTTTTNRVVLSGSLNGVSVGTTNVDVTDDAISLKVERFGNIWKFYYSTSQSPNYDWIKVVQVEDPQEYLTRTISLTLSAYSPADNVDQTVQVDYDNFKYYTNFGYIEDTLSKIVARGTDALVGTCNSNMLGSTTSIFADNLIGYGDDYFNNNYQLIIIKNSNSIGASPQMEKRNISDYVSATGAFATEAFSSNVEANDTILIVQNNIASLVSVYGIADSGDANTIVDSLRTEAEGYWEGHSVVMLSGNARGQVREIWDFTAATDSIEVRPSFAGVIGAGDVYVILTTNFYSIATADATNNTSFVDVIGNKSDAIPAMNIAPGADSIVAHAKAILERLGATPADSDDSVLTNVGQRDDTATADTLGDITTTSIQAKLRRILLRFSSDAFAATIQGASRTDVETMLAQLATYFSNAGAAWSVQINNNTARTNLEQVLEDLAAVIGVDGVNVFDPSIGGSSRTTVDAAFGAVGTALGAEYDGTPDLYDVTVTGHDSSAITANKDGSIEERLEDLLISLSSGKIGTLPSFSEFWMDEGGIQAQYWTTAVGVTGTAARDVTEAGYAKVLLNCPAASDTSNIYSVHRWKAAPVTASATAGYGTKSIVKKLIFEQQVKTGTLANIDNTTTFLGLSVAQGDTRATNDIIGFIFVADVLTAVTDAAGVETTTDVSAGITITNYNKLKIEIYSGGVKFYINETLVATHSTDISDYMRYINNYIKAEAATGATSLSVGPIRIYYQDEI